jgi:uncharacterized protein (DUF433 family)
MNHAAARLRNAEIAIRYHAGESAEALAKEFGLVFGYIYAISRKAGMSREKRGLAERTLRRRAVMAELHSLGLSGGHARRLLNIGNPLFSIEAKRCGLKFPYDRSGKWSPKIAAAKAKAEKMAGLYRSGMTLEQIGAKYGISRERVRQLMTKHVGMRQDGGGQHVKAVAKRQQSAASKDTRYLRKYGCTFAQYVEVREIGRVMRLNGAGVYQTPLRAFINQKNNAKQRNIPWELTFWQWWTIWQESGKWAERGRAKDAYVMSRFRDAGNYAVGNIYIGTLAENSSIQPNNPYRKDHPDHAAVAYTSLKRTLEQRLSGPGRHKKNSDLPRGVTRNPRSKSFQAQATMRGKSVYLGSFPTIEEARAAYVAAVLADVNSAHQNSEAA